MLLSKHPLQDSGRELAARGPNGALRMAPPARIKNKTACKPGSVQLQRSLWQPFIWDARHHAPQATYPNSARTTPKNSYLVLLRVGFTLPWTVTSHAVRSYRTLSPLPMDTKAHRRFAFCGTFRRLSPPRHYLAPCPLEPGLSSPSGTCLPQSGDGHRRQRLPSCLANGGA